MQMLNELNRVPYAIIEFAVNNDYEAISYNKNQQMNASECSSTSGLS